MATDEASGNQRRRWLGTLRAIVRRLRDCIGKMSCKDWIDTAAAAGTLFVAGILFFTALTYWEQEKTNRLKRTSEVITAAEKSVNEEERTDIIREFPGRWQKNVRFCLGREEAESFLEVAVKPEDSAKYKRWNLARKHLNGVETLAFPYYYDLADRRILTTSSCGYVTRSNKYFGHLIAVFGAYFGGGQSWQVIAKAAKLMEDEWGPGCMRLPLEQPRVERPYYRLPAEATAPAGGERGCVGGPAFPDAK